MEWIKTSSWLDAGRQGHDLRSWDKGLGGNWGARGGDDLSPELSQFLHRNRLKVRDPSCVSQCDHLPFGGA